MSTRTAIRLVSARRRSSRGAGDSARRRLISMMAPCRSCTSMSIVNSMAALSYPRSKTLAVSPNGVIFLKPHVRRSLLAKMLTEILDTRVMVKSSMNRYSDKVRSISLRLGTTLDRSTGSAQDVQRSSARSEIHRQRHLRLHLCYLFRSNALRRDRRCHRSDWSRNA